MTGRPVGPDERVQAKGGDFGVSKPVKGALAKHEQDGR